ncbi:MAG: aminotransferase class V-fold PLP-dependent enzyme [Clostridiales bacterium]|nr:aminotransferase class V-fold PLP-dependent enzyme [Clostridiales bacterium]
MNHVNQIYLDHAATSDPKPFEVISAVVNALSAENANPGRSGYPRAIHASNVIFNCRREIADFLSASDPMEIAFTYNCTDAINLAIRGVLKKGDHVILSALEHNSVLRVLGEMQRAGEIDMDIVLPKENGYIDPKDYLKRTKPNTALLILTHASNVTGAVQPVEAVGCIAKSLGIPYLIDGAQALGEIMVDVPKCKCDLYAFAGHKGLLGPQGTGGLFINSGIILKPFRAGGTGSSSESIYQPSEAPDRYEAGTMNFPGISGLLAGVRYTKAHFRENTYHIRSLTNALYEGLSAVSGVTVYTPSNEAYRTGVISFNVNNLSSQDSAAWLSERGFCLRSGLHCAPYAHAYLGTLERGAVRASVGYANTFDEIEKLVEQVYYLSKIQ